MYRPSPLLAPLLFVPGLLFEALVRARNLSYAKGILTPRRLPRPVISIGNLTLGGSGKTPLVIHAAKVLVKFGCVPALLSRGHGRQSPSESLILRPGELVSSPAFTLGDEPALIRRHVPGIWLGISSDRHSAGLGIAAQCPDAAFLLDDGLQHRRLHRDLDLVVIDRCQPHLRNHVFPRGSLREPFSELRRCGMALINGTAGTCGEDDVEAAVMGTIACDKIFRCIQKIEALVPFPEWDNPSSSELRGARCDTAFLAAALGNPIRFLRDVESLGIHVSGSRFFRDHHRLGVKEWRQCVREAERGSAEAIIITEKDAIKVVEKPDFPLLVAVQSTLIDRQSEFEQTILHSLGKAR